jgi:hypothetical protein
MTLDALLARLREPRRAGQGWLAFCPAHDDRAKASLSVCAGRRRLLLHCFAGCSDTAIVEALGLTPRDLRLDAEPSTRAQDPPGRVVVTYDYRDEVGTLLYHVDRFVPKAFRPRQPDGRRSLDGVRRVLYRLPALQGQARVVVCEGEKDVEAVRALGLVATTSQGGAKAWRDDYGDQLMAAGVKAVVILPHHDAAGEQYAGAVARTGLVRALTVTILRLPDLPDKGDVSDWLARGGTLDAPPSVAALKMSRAVADSKFASASLPVRHAACISLRMSSGYVSVPIDMLMPWSR